MNPALDLVLGKLENVQQRNGRWEAFCPVHGDTSTRHLYVKEGDRQPVVVHCHHSDCSYEDVKAALGITNLDLYPAPQTFQGRTDYPIRDRAGREQATHERVERNGKKAYRWKKDGEYSLGGLPTENLPLYRTEVLDDAPDAHVVLTEGEKATEALVGAGFTAVGTTTGASSTPSRESLGVLEGRTVICWPDNDDAGRDHMRRCARILDRLGCEVKWFEWPDAPPGGDAADHPAPEDLPGSFAMAERWHPEPDPRGARGAAWVHHRFLDYLDRRDAGGGITGVRSGIAKLDRELEGFNDGHSYVVAASTGVGKSLVCGQIALKAALDGNRVLLATPEMKDLEIHKRMVFYLAGVDYFAWKRRVGTPPSDREKLEAASRRLTRLPYFYNPTSDQTVDDLARDIEDWEPDLVIVDYVQYLHGPGATEYEKVSELAYRTHALKEDFDVPVIVAAQLNRNQAHRAKSQPQLSDIQGSGKIEHGADAVLMLHRPDKGDDRVKNEEVTLLCPKNRTGEEFETTLWFVPGQNWLTDERPAAPFPNGSGPSWIASEVE